MTTLFEALDLLGRMTWGSLWVPLLIWTALASPVWLLLRQTDRLHPLAEYRLSQVLLAVLPIGIGVTALIDVAPASMRGAVVSDASFTVLPVVEGVEAATPRVTWQWTHAAGLATAGAALAGLVSLGRLLFEAVAVLRVRTRAETYRSEKIQSRIDHWCDERDVRRPVRVRVCPEIAVPMTLGGALPLLLIPPDLTNRAEALRMTLLHELVHIGRYDDWTHFAERIIAALFVAHPLVGRLRHHIAEARERACDATVLTDEETLASSYARLLVAFSQNSPRSNRLGALSLSESTASLTTRLQAMSSSASNWLSTLPVLHSTALILGLALTLGITACSESIPSSTDALTEERASSQSVEELPLPIRDEPLYVVDGEIRNSTDDLRSDDITSIEVLRDSAAVDVYGEGAANGVIIITTKQETTRETSAADQYDEEVYVAVEENPDCGGRRALRKNIQYPKHAQKSGMEGRVIVRFVVDENGNVQDPRITRGEYEILNEAALHAVQQLDCDPGMQEGTPVRVQMSLPVLFQLPDKESSRPTSMLRPGGHS